MICPTCHGDCFILTPLGRDAICRTCGGAGAVRAVGRLIARDGLIGTLSRVIYVAWLLSFTWYLRKRQTRLLAENRRLRRRLGL